uniref:Transposase n=1 Tax=Meloidogyne hapla TaxID=6305 RepID=A0A1I8B2B8_MELHA
MKMNKELIVVMELLKIPCQINYYLPSNKSVKYYSWQQTAFDLSDQLK